MNPHFTTPKGGLHRTLRVLSLLLLQHALVPVGTTAHARSRLPENPDSDPVDTESRPYLKVAGSLPLRFSAPPRQLAGLPVMVPVAVTSSQPIASTSNDSVNNPPPAPLTPKANLDLKNPLNDQPVVPTTPASGKPTLSILPDDTRPSTRAEDFLPFFQFPAAGGDVTVVVPASIAKPPAPGQMPVSSATYQQR